MKYRSVRPVLMGLLFWIAGRVALADDLYLTWVKSSSPTSQTLRSVVFGNGIFVAVGDGGILLASQDGVSWGLREVGVTNDLRDITFGNGRFVAMGDAIVTSTDASVWTARSAALPLFGAAYGNGTFSGVGTGDPSAHGFSCNVCGILGGQNECPGDAQGTEFIVASDDGYSWRSLTNTTDFEALRDVIYGNGRFIAVGTRFFYYQLDWGTHDGFYSWYYLCHISPVFKGSSWTSTDGYSWTRSADASKWLRSIAFGGNNFVAVGAAGLIQTTIDAGSWDTISSGSGADLNGVGYGGGAFLAVGDGGALLVSGDGGSTWSARQTGTSSNLFGVAYGKGIAVAVGAGGTILCSGSALPTASIAGKVTGNRLPLVGAQVRVEGTAYAASTDINGDFTIVGVPVSSGYVLLASACGYGSARRPGIVVNQGDNSIPDFDLQVVNGPYQLIALVPDVNPKTNTIEEGGTAYRYYCLIAADGHTPVSCGTVSVRVAGGSDIPQLGDASDTWVGRTAGVPDADGVVRLRIPASAIGPVNTCQTLQVLESGVGIPNLSFQACVVPRQYEQVWKHKFGGGVSFKGEGVRVGVEGAYESAIRRHILGSAVDWEEIKRSRSVEGRAGVEVGTGVRLGAVAVGAKTGAGGFIEGEASTTYDLPYGSTDPGVNAMKLYVAAGDPLSLCAGPAKGLVDLVRAKYEQWYMKDNLKDASGGLTIGGYTEADASVGFGLGQAGDVKIGASGSAEVAAFSQYTIEYKDQGRPAQGEPVSRSIGMSSSAKSSFNLGLCSPNPTKGGLGFQFFVGADSSYKSIVTKRSDLDYYHEIAVEQACQLNYGVTVKALPGFGDSYDPDVTPSADFRREFTETVMLNFTDAGGFGELASREPFWGAVSSGSFGIMLPDLNARMLQSLFDTSVSRGLLVDYHKSVYGAYKLDVGGDFGADALVAGLSLMLEGELERGAEMKVESGHYWQGRRLALASYPAISQANIPTKEIYWLEGEWAYHATEPIREALHLATVVVANTVNTVVDAGEGAIHAVLSIAAGVMPGGSEIKSSWRTDLGVTGMKPAYFPPSGSSNYTYGVSGIFRFESTNTFDGVGTLVIAFSDAQVEGLDKADLRIYRLPDGTNRWQLVGGVVDTVSNIVSATIANLGTYAIAPPLPTGDLWLQPSTNGLPADGVSETTVVVTNLLLNTGVSATQEWLFAASAVGVEVLSSDADTNTPGVQIVSTNATLTLQLRAPAGGTHASVSLKSVAGDAYGQVGINLADNTPPATPTNVSVIAGQSRIWVSWRTNSEPDLAGYRVYYRAGAAGPPWDGTATVEGAQSPVQVSGTNVLLRGLSLGTNYFVALSAVDTTGNESPLTPAVAVTTSQAVPTAPTGVAVRFGSGGTNILMWALSEDDGYNDRDVDHYDIFLAVLPGGSYVKVGEVRAGIGLYSGTNLSVAATQYVGYAVSAVASNGSSSTLAPATRFMVNEVAVDTDGDGIPDWWMIQYFGHPTGQATDQSFAQSYPAGDGLSNLQKYLLGLNPFVPARPYLQPLLSPANGNFALNIQGLFGRSVTLEVSPDLASWQSLTNLTGTSSVIYFEDWGVTNSERRFYRVVVPARSALLPPGNLRVTGVSGGSVTLAWDPSPGIDVAGYKIHWGTASRTYTNVTSAAATTTASMSGLLVGTTYYFAATAVDTSGMESGYSNEVSILVP